MEKNNVLILGLISVIIIIATFKLSAHGLRPASTLGQTGGRPCFREPRKPLTKIDKITQILENQQKILKLALDDKCPSGHFRPVKPEVKVEVEVEPKVEVEVKPKDEVEVKPKIKPSKVYQDWARLSTATQSSNYAGYSASMAIDGNPKTYSHTDIKQGRNSWLKIALPKQIEVNKIVIENRPGPKEIKRLPPFIVSIKNSSGAITASKQFTDALQTYTWSDIFVVGSEVTIEQLKPQYLHVAEVKIFGVEAESCSYYEERVALNRDVVSTLFQKLKNSACMLGLTADSKATMKPALSPAEIKKEAALFDKVMAKQEKAQEKKIKEAKQLVTKIEAQVLKEQQLNAQAKKYGIAPPAPMYSKKQLDSAKKATVPVTRKLTDKEKAECMMHKRTIDSLQKEIEAMSKSIDPENMSETDRNKLNELGERLKSVQAVYDSRCGLPESAIEPTGDIFDRPPVRDIEPPLS